MPDPEVIPATPAVAAVAPAPAAPIAPVQPETFSREYVSELRAENKGWRLKADEQTRLAAEAKAAAEAATTAAEAKIAEAATAAQQRVILAEMKAAAIKAGMVDLDGLKLADLTKVTMDDKGEVQGADALLTELKTAKPYLFTVPSTSSTNKTPGTAGSATKTSFRDMTPEQRDAELRRRGVPGI